MYYATYWIQPLANLYYMTPEAQKHVGNEKVKFTVQQQIVTSGDDKGQVLSDCVINMKRYYPNALDVTLLMTNNQAAELRDLLNAHLAEHAD
jgi:hypothetical protein